MDREIKIGRIYRHFKGNFYYVKEIVNDSETQGGEIVIYQALYDNYGTYARNLEMFLELIDENREDNITGQKERFKEVNLRELIK